MHCDTIVLGAGIVGVSTALQLQARGRNVVLLDRAQPGSGTSHGQGTRSPAPPAPWRR